MDLQKEREAFDQYFKEKYPELYKDVFNEDGDDRAIIGYSFAWSAWQAKAQAVPEGFVLIKDDTKTIVAIERMVEQQIEASGMDSRRLERLDGWKIIEAAVKAQEPAND